MTTAMDQWAADQQQGGTYADDNEFGGVSETDISGRGAEDEAGTQGHDLSFAEPGETGAAAAAEPSPEDEARRAKLAKDKRILMIGGGVVAAIGLAFGVSLFTRSGDHQQAQPAVPPLAVNAGMAPPVGQPPVVAMVPGPAAGVAAPVDMTPPAGPASAATAALDPGSTLMAPVAAGAAPGLASASMPAPSAKPAPAPAQSALSPATTAAADSGEIERLRAEMAGLRKDMEQTVGALRKELASRSSSAVAAASPAPKPTPVKVARTGTEKPFDGITEKAEKPQKPANPSAVAATTEKQVDATPAAVVDAKPAVAPTAPPLVKGGKVRTDFTVYAISNGRAWVRWSGDGENHMVGLNSVLPDNSRVTKIDDVNGVVFSSAGEIHVKPAAK